MSTQLFAWKYTISKQGRGYGELRYREEEADQILGRKIIEHLKANPGRVATIKRSVHVDPGYAPDYRPEESKVTHLLELGVAETMNLRVHETEQLVVPPRPWVRVEKIGTYLRGKWNALIRRIEQA